VQILRKLANSANVLVENFSPRVLPNLGLAPQSLLETNPSLVVVSISNFGQTGPNRDLPASHLTEYALGGSMYIIGDSGYPPLQGPGRQSEYVAGLFAAIGTLAAVNHAALMGEGQHVDVSILEAVASIQENTTSTWAYSGDIWKRNGSRRLPYPMTILPCRDGYIGMNAVTEQQWEMMLTLMDRRDLLDDPRFANGLSRLEYADDLDAELTKWLVEHDKEDVYHRAQTLRVPFGRVSTTSELLSNPHLAAREYFARTDHPKLGMLTLPGVPCRLPDSPCRLNRAPLLGEHTAEVLGALGFEADDISRLMAMGVI
jgi:crotonobetainyl-CoA:carnitine CoA-transferase CaiB-like acyl-CoA transferase